jgi:hypothetical protein
MALGDKCVHTATPVLTTTATEDEEHWIEGEPDEEIATGASFDCLYLAPTGASESDSPRGRRKISQPTILFEGERDDGSLIELIAEDEVVVFAEEVLGASKVTKVGGTDVPGVLFQVDGDPTPLAAPGDLIGWEARLKKVID